MTLAHVEKLDKVESNTDILNRCKNAGDLFESGDYEGAQVALGPFWPNTGEMPDIEGLDEATKAEVLLRTGVLSGRSQTPDSQERAKDLLTNALRLFESLDNKTKSAETRFEMGLCYWRAGALDEARIVLEEALSGLGETELKAKTLIRLTLVEIWQGRYLDAWDTLRKAQPLFENCSEATKGRWHGQQALVLRRLATAENRTDYVDRAIMEFTAAIFHYEQAGHDRHRARNLNNLAMLMYKLGRYSEAHENLDRARRVFLRLNERTSVAQVDETRSRVLVAEQRYREAETVIRSAVVTLQGVGEQAPLAEALTIQATIQARRDQQESSLSTFRRAMRIGEEAGANASAGLAALSMIEEHYRSLGEAELHEVYRRADSLLSQTQDTEHIARLRKCASLIVESLKLGDRSLPEAVNANEARYIERALIDENGSITRAARALRVSHQALASILNGRHKSLLVKRTPIVNRRRSIIKIKQPKKGRRFFAAAKGETAAGN